MEGRLLSGSTTHSVGIDHSLNGWITHSVGIARYCRDRSITMSESLTIVGIGRSLLSVSPNRYVRIDHSLNGEIAHSPCWNRPLARWRIRSITLLGIITGGTPIVGIVPRMGRNLRTFRPIVLNLPKSLRISPRVRHIRAHSSYNY